MILRDHYKDSLGISNLKILEESYDIKSSIFLIKTYTELILLTRYTKCRFMLPI